MKFISVFVLFVSCFCWAFTLPALHRLPEGGQNYAVLVAGSNTYDNYRHQADICHAFQNLIAHGIPASNIIVMMYDDIAHDPENPHQGKVINQPNGPDVYQGVNKDYTGEDVNPQNFLKVLVGDPDLKAQGKKVLESGPNDNVFIYFADHGGTLLLGFPEDILAASDLIATLNKMNEMKKYNKLVFYVEACESGSMFENLLPSNWSILATTAAGPDESSFGCFCNVPENTCLGDQYSVNWLIDSDTGKDFGGETLEQQFEIVKNETDLSQVHKYGDLTFTNLPLSDFQGSVDPPSKPDPIKKCDDDAVESGEIPIHLMKRRIQSASDDEKPMLIEKLNKMIEARNFVDNSVMTVATELFLKGHMEFSKYMFTSRPITRHECAEKLIKTFHSACFNLARHTYALRYTRVMANIAENLRATDLNEKCTQVASDLEAACRQHVSENSYERIV